MFLLPLLLVTSGRMNQASGSRFPRISGALSTMKDSHDSKHANIVCISAPFGGYGESPHGDVGRGTRTIPQRDHRDGGVLHPAFVLAESLTRGTSWRLAGRLLRVLENMHSPKVGLGEASLRDSDKHACGAL